MRWAEKQTNLPNEATPSYFWDKPDTLKKAKWVDVVPSNQPWVTPQYGINPTSEWLDRWINQGIWWKGRCFFNQMKQSLCLSEFYKSDIVETDEIETSTNFLNFADVNFKLIALKFHRIPKKEGK